MTQQSTGAYGAETDGPGARRHVRNCVSVHDFAFFKSILPGIEQVGRYTDRSQAYGVDVAVLMDDDRTAELVEYHGEYLLPVVGVGARELHFVSGDSLYEGLLANEQLRARVYDLVSNGAGTRIEAFTPQGDWPTFVQALGVPIERIRSPVDLDMVRQLDDKAQLRHLAAQMGWLTWFPEHQFATDPMNATRKVENMLRMYGGVVIKRPDLEGGESVFTVRPHTAPCELGNWIANYMDGEQEVIVERDLRTVRCKAVVEISTQWYISKDELKKRFMSQQIISGNSHAGNGIAAKWEDSLPSWIPEPTRRAIARVAEERSRAMAKWAQEHGYVGLIGFDGILVLHEDGSFELYWIEANARPTAATYLENIRYQVETSGRMENVCAAMCNVKPNGLYTWRDVVARLSLKRWGADKGSLATDSETGRGVFALNIRMLPDKLLLVAVAPNMDEALSLLDRAKQRVEAPWWKRAAKRMSGFSRSVAGRLRRRL